MKLPEEVKKKAQPAFVSPELATLVNEPFSDKNWIFEKKLDGVRCIVVRKGDKITLYSRNRKKMNQTYPELIEPLKKQNAKSYIVDGEIVTEKGKLGSFSKLQGRMNIQQASKAALKKTPVSLYLFDLIYLEGYDFRKVPLLERKKALKKALSYRGRIHFTSHRLKEGEKYFREACKRGWEGVIAKKARSIYLSKRTRDWLKFKGTNEQEFIICGYTPPSGSRVGFGALLIGYYEGKKLRFAGKVGTGYDTEMLKSLGKKLQSIEKSKSPFSEDVRIKGAHYVQPTLVCQIGFTEWTLDKKLRHPRFLGLRKDKSPKDVKREYAKKSRK